MKNLKEIEVDEKKINLSQPKNAFINPRLVALGWNVGMGDTVADLGCGGGYFVIPLAHLVGKKGKVYAVDVLDGPLESVRSKAHLENLENIVLVKQDIEKKNSLSDFIKKEECQWVIIANTLYSSPKKGVFLKEAKRILSSKGKLIIVEWKKSVSKAFEFFGPPLESRIDEKKLKSLVEKEGFRFVKSFSAGKFHVGMIFTK